MPIKTNGTGKRWVEMDILVPGTPEQVWRAMATGAGNAAWFTKTAIEERLGGEIRFDFGRSGSSSGEVTAWEPPHRFGYIERDWSEGAPPVETEITIAGRGGDGCAVRMAHSLTSPSDGWDAQLESFEQGWPAFFDVLRAYLRHFAGQPAASFMAVASVEGDTLTVWERLTDQLALSGADVGEPRTTARQPEALSGVVERVQQDDRQRLLLLRLNAPAPGMALFCACGADPQVHVSVSLYLYGNGAATRADASAGIWQGWLEERFANGAAKAGAQE